MAITAPKVPKPSDPQMLKRSQSSAREAWRMWEIISEFVGATENLQQVHPAVSIFGSARTKPGHPYYQLAEEVARRLSEAGFSVVSGGGTTQEVPFDRMHGLEATFSTLRGRIATIGEASVAMIYPSTLGTSAAPIIRLARRLLANS